MKAVHLVQIDKLRPAVLLTRDHAQPLLRRVTVAPITSTVRGLPIEVAVLVHNGLEHASVINCDNVMTVMKSAVGRRLGFLMPEQEEQLARAISYAFDLHSGD